MGYGRMLYLQDQRLKTNNYDKEIAGAKFRLYSDAECKNEVYVKAKDGSVDNGYIVINRDSTDVDDHIAAFIAWKITLAILFLPSPARLNCSFSQLTCFSFHVFRSKLSVLSSLKT